MKKIKEEEIISLFSETNFIRTYEFKLYRLISNTWNYETIKDSSDLIFISYQVSGTNGFDIKLPYFFDVFNKKENSFYNIFSDSKYYYYLNFDTSEFCFYTNKIDGIKPDKITMAFLNPYC